MLNTRTEEINPAENSIHDGHVGDELPIIFLQYGVSAKSVNKASGSWNRMNQLQMEGSAPSIIFVLPVDVLLLLSEHEPVETHDDEVANNRHRVQQMVSSLQVNRSVRGLETVLREICGVVRGADRGQKRDRGQHQGPVGERNEEAIPVHVEEVGHVTCHGSSQHQISHSLSCVNFPL